VSRWREGVRGGHDHLRVDELEAASSEERAVQHERLELAALAGAVAPELALDAEERRAVGRQGRAEVPRGVEAHGGDLDEDGVDAGGADQVEDARLRLAPHVREGDEAEVRAHSLHAEALVIAQDGARGDRANAGRRVHDRREERPEVLDLVAEGIVRAHLVGNVRPHRRTAKAPAEQREAGQVAVRRHRAMPHRLEAVRVQLLHVRVGGEQVRERDDAVAVRLGEHRRHDAVLAAGYQRDRIERGGHRRRPRASALLVGEQRDHAPETPNQVTTFFRRAGAEIRLVGGSKVAFSATTATGTAAAAEGGRRVSPTRVPVARRALSRARGRSGLVASLPPLARV
jgi:hypothetical protein